MLVLESFLKINIKVSLVDYTFGGPNEIIKVLLLNNIQGEMINKI